MPQRPSAACVTQLSARSVGRTVDSYIAIWCCSTLIILTAWKTTISSCCSNSSDTPRQGPESAEATRRALRLLPDSLRVERVLDLGCGTGASTIVLAQDTGAHVMAVDIHPPFLATLRARAEEHGLADRITMVVADMAKAASLGAGFDLIWAEGSAYSVGFENALRRWRPLLRPGGCLVVTELVWFVAEPAERARAFFAGEYPDMRDEATRIDQARSARYDLLGSFRLPSRRHKRFSQPSAGRSSTASSLFRMA